MFRTRLFILFVREATATASYRKTESNSGRHDQCRHTAWRPEFDYEKREGDE